MSSSGEVNWEAWGLPADFDPNSVGDAIASSLAVTFKEEAVQQFVNPHVLNLPDLLIKTKERKLVQFHPNNVQTSYLDQLYAPRGLDWKTSLLGLRGLREIILKGRQFGLSTLVLGIFFLDTICTPHTNTVVIAHNLEATERLFRTVQRFYDHLPFALRPETSIGNKREYYWKKIDSSFSVATAGNVNFARSGMINNVHATELPFWPDAEELMTGLMESVPDDGNVFLESTARGLGNYFHSEWKKATLPRSESEFTPRFFFWGNHEEYRIRSLHRLEKYLDTPLDDEEIELRDVYGLDREQLAWRRSKIRVLGKKFRQEYPSTPDEAFLTSGDGYFDMDALNSMSKRLQHVDFNPIPTRKLPIPESRTRLLKERDGLAMWLPPQRGRSYVISADPAEGLRDWGERDYCSTDVMDAESWEQVAHLHGRWDPFTYAGLLFELAWWYNFALLGVESNNHGHAVLSHLIHTFEYPAMNNDGWGGLYYHEAYDERKKIKRRKPGFPTTPKTKYKCLDDLAESIIHGDIHIRSRRTVSELLTYVKLAGGKAGAEGNSHDDCVSSLAIADQLLRIRHGFDSIPLATAGKAERNPPGLLIDQLSTLKAPLNLDEQFRNHSESHEVGTGTGSEYLSE